MSYTGLIFALSIIGTSGFCITGTRTCCTSPLFVSPKTTITTRMNRKIYRTLLFDQLDMSSSSSSSEEDAKNAEIVDEKTSGDLVASKTPQKTLFQKFDDYCLKFKPKAFAANEKAETFTEDKTKKLLYKSKSCAFFGLFILYRAYRGLFYILPAIFSEVYRKMEKTVKDPFDDDDISVEFDEDSETAKAALANPETGVVRLRTRAVVSMLATLVTLSYVMTGAFKVLQMFVSTATRTSSVEGAFEAAADEIITNEDRVMRLAKQKKTPINGEDLAP